jgi:hypothetical protein
MRKQVASDTTMHTSLQTVDPQIIREFLKLVYLRGKQKGLIRVRSEELNNLRLAALDGNKFGKFLNCTFRIIDNPGLFLDVERIPKTGKELPTSRNLLKRVVKRFGKGFVDLLLLDGLYFSHEDINFCLQEAQIHVLIKLKGKGLEHLNILKDAEAIFSNHEFKNDVEYISGIDERRMKRYEV